MKRFFSTVAFCVFLFIFGWFVLSPHVAAEKNTLLSLLNLPAPPPLNPANSAPSTDFPPEFFNKNDPPDDDAPIEKLEAYWSEQSGNYRELGYNIKPSERVLQRLKSSIESDPAKLDDFINVMPENSVTADFVKRIYDRTTTGDKADEERGTSIKKWLTYHSSYYSDELLKDAQQVGDARGYVTNQGELLALARVDWAKASPILERLYNDDRQPVSQTLARWAYYRHALDADSTSDIEKYRDELKKVVENKSATAGMRDLAFDALVKEKEWSGLDDWYVTLMEDETLADLRVNGESYTGLTTIMSYSPPEKRLEKMLQLVKSSNPTVRGAAVRNLTQLLDAKNEEVVRALLPWLENPEWARETNGERLKLVNALANFSIPESVPGLIAVLNEKNAVRALPPNLNTNRMMANLNASRNNNFEYPYRREAVGALAKQKDFRAVGALREILPQVEPWQRGYVVQALLASGGFSIHEQVEALETNIQKSPPEADVYESNAVANVSVDEADDVEAEENPVLTGESSVMVSNSMMTSDNRPFKQSDIPPILAAQIISRDEVDDNLVAALIDRIGVLDVKNPPVALGLRKILMRWNTTAINALLLRDVKNDRADVDTIVKLLSLRKDLREKQLNDVYDSRNGGSQTAFGIATCILENPAESDALLQTDRAMAKTALLAGARLIRTALPIAKVAANLNASDALLVTAAERYLIAEDSIAAQNLVLARHPNEALILGAKQSFINADAPVSGSLFLSELFASVNGSAASEYGDAADSSSEIAAAEKKLRKEAKEDQQLLGVYAYDSNFIRIYKDKTVFSWQTEPARFRERELTTGEFEAFKNYLLAEKVSELPPFLESCGEECEERELLMLGRNGGRRIYMAGDREPPFFKQLDALFAQMRQPPAKLRYELEKNFAGLEILLADDNLKAEAVWKNGADFRVLLSDTTRGAQITKELEKADEADEPAEGRDYHEIWKIRMTRHARREFENFVWYRIADGKFAGTTDQPAAAAFIPQADGATVLPQTGQWKRRTAALEIRADTGGLYRISGGRTTKIGDGYYLNPVVSANGRWALVLKFAEESGSQLVRVNLTTNRETPVKIASNYGRPQPVVFVPTLDKFLIFNGGFQEYEDKSDNAGQGHGEFYLLDPATGAISKATGELRPLAQQSYRVLQPTGKTDEFWAAIPDVKRNETNVGVYNARTLIFNSRLKIPQIQFNSMQMWIDADVIYFVYQGHLLDLPLPK